MGYFDDLPDAGTAVVAQPKPTGAFADLPEAKGHFDDLPSTQEAATGRALWAGLTATRTAQQALPALNQPARWNTPPPPETPTIKGRVPFGFGNYQEVTLPANPMEPLVSLPNAEMPPTKGDVTLSTPIGVPMKVNKEMMGQAGAALYNVGKSIPEFMLSPAGGAATATGGTPLGSAVAKGLFSGLAAKTGAQQLGEASVTGNPQQAMEGVLGLAMAPSIALGKHGQAKPQEPATPVQQPVTRPVEVPKVAPVAPAPQSPAVPLADPTEALVADLRSNIKPPETPVAPPVEKTPEQAIDNLAAAVADLKASLTKNQISRTEPVQATVPASTAPAIARAESPAIPESTGTKPGAESLAKPLTPDEQAAAQAELDAMQEPNEPITQEPNGPSTTRQPRSIQPQPERTGPLGQEPQGSVANRPGREEAGGAIPEQRTEPAQSGPVELPSNIPNQIRAVAKNQLAKLEAAGLGETEQAQRLRKTIGAQTDIQQFSEEAGQAKQRLEMKGATPEQRAVDENYIAEASKRIGKAQKQLPETKPAAVAKVKAQVRKVATTEAAVDAQLSPREAIGEETPRTTVAPDEAQSRISEWRKSNPTAPDVELVDRPDWTATGSDGNRRLVRGQYSVSTEEYGSRQVRRSITVNRAAIRDAAELESVLNHEHAHGLLTSEEGQKALDQVVRQKLGNSGIAILRERYAQRKGENAAAYDRRLREEWLARLAEEKRPVWKQVVQAVKVWLAKHGITRLTDEEIGREILSGLKREGAGEEGRYSLSDEYLPAGDDLRTPEQKAREQEGDRLANEAKALREEVRALKAAGKPVPDELFERAAAADADLHAFAAGAKQPRGGINAGLKAVAERPQPKPQPGAGADEIALQTEGHNIMQRFARFLKTMPGREEMARGYQAANTEAIRTANKTANTILHDLNRQFGESIETRHELREAALSVATEAQANAESLTEAAKLVAESKFAKTVWGRKITAAIQFALENLDRLAPVVAKYKRLTDAEIESENATGVETPEFTRGGYVPHKQDLAAESAMPEGGSEFSGAAAPFKHIRDFATYAEAISKGVMPETLSAIELLRHRVALGRKLVNGRVWMDSLMRIPDPSWRPGDPMVGPNKDQVPPLATMMEVRTRRDGSTDSTAPRGYHPREFGGMKIAVRDGYQGLFSDFTKGSFMREGYLRPAVMKAATTTKHFSLLFDTFHLGRLAFWASMVRGAHPSPLGGFLPSPQPFLAFLPDSVIGKEWNKGYKKGLMLLDNTPEEIKMMAHRNEIPKEWAEHLVADLKDGEFVLKGGLNVGTIADNLHREWIKKIPVLGSFNNFLFREYQRGAVYECGIIEYRRRRQMYGKTETPEQTGNAVAKDLNKRFGSLGTQSWMKSAATKDVTKLLMLAPEWNEGLIRSEVGAAVQIPKSAWDSYKNRRFAMGTLGRAVVTASVGQFLAAQVINYITRGHPTWQNPEEEPGAKLSAWIPDVVGHGPGFLLNPIALPMEVAHMLWNWTDRAGGDFSKALRQYAMGRLGTLARPGAVFALRETAMGRKLRTGAEVMQEMAKAALPVPIGMGAYGRAAKEMITGENEEVFPGQFQKQIMQSFGVKADNAPSAEQRIRNLAMDWRREQPNFKPEQEFYSGDYTDLKSALKLQNQRDARTALRELRTKKSDQEIEKYFRDFMRHPFTGSRGKEAQFKATLDPEQLATYDRARDEQKKIGATFRQLWQEVRQEGPNTSGKKR